MESQRMRRNWVDLEVGCKNIQGRKIAMYEHPEEKVPKTIGEPHPD